MEDKSHVEKFLDMLSKNAVPGEPPRYQARETAVYAHDMNAPAFQARAVYPVSVEENENGGTTTKYSDGSISVQYGGMGPSFDEIAKAVLLERPVEAVLPKKLFSIPAEVRLSPAVTTSEQAEQLARDVREAMMANGGRLHRMGGGGKGGGGSTEYVYHVPSRPFMGAQVQVENLSVIMEEPKKQKPAAKAPNWLKEPKTDLRYGAAAWMPQED